MDGYTGQAMQRVGADEVMAKLAVLSPPLDKCRLDHFRLTRRHLRWRHESLVHGREADVRVNSADLTCSLFATRLLAHLPSYHDLLRYFYNHDTALPAGPE